MSPKIVHIREVKSKRNATSSEGRKANAAYRASILLSARAASRFRTVLPLLKNTERCEVDADAATDI
jgi:hypothetical protein